MNTLFPNHDWYDIIKDIVLPFIGIVSTVVLGTIIAGLLRHREERSRVKMLLIDTFIEFINSREKFERLVKASIVRKIFRSILERPKLYYNEDVLVFQDYLQKEIAELDDSLDKQLSEESRKWAIYIDKFDFLLGGSKKAREELHYKKWSIHFFLKGVQEKMDEIEKDVKENEKLLTFLRSSDQHDYREGYWMLNETIEQSFTPLKERLLYNYDDLVRKYISEY